MIKINTNKLIITASLILLMLSPNISLSHKKQETYKFEHIAHKAILTKRVNQISSQFKSVLCRFQKQIKTIKRDSVHTQHHEPLLIQNKKRACHLKAKNSVRNILQKAKLIKRELYRLRDQDILNNKDYTEIKQKVDLIHNQTQAFITNINKRLTSKTKKYSTYAGWNVQHLPCEYEICSICLEEMPPKTIKSYREIKRVKCKHKFHSDCIQAWMHEKMTVTDLFGEPIRMQDGTLLHDPDSYIPCPLCRENINPAYK